MNNVKPANRTIWTANHPPLYYLVAAVPLRLGVDLGHPLGGIRAARLLNVGISLVGLVLVVLLARELVPARPELWVAAAGLAALVPGLVMTSAIVYNDALMFTLTTAALVLITRMLRWGPTTRRLVLLAVLAAAAALTRATGLIVVVVAALAAVVAVWRHDRAAGPDPGRCSRPRPAAPSSLRRRGRRRLVLPAQPGAVRQRHRHRGAAAEVLPPHPGHGPAGPRRPELLA